MGAPHVQTALVCIDEPELGLHPDMLPKIADLLISAAARTQLIVTTHSDILVDAMTDRILTHMGLPLSAIPSPRPSTAA